MLKMFALWKKARNIQRAGAKTLSLVSDFKTDASRLERVASGTRKTVARSLLIRHLDSGSNNSEEAELIALNNPMYDLSRFGFDFTASPRHADILAVTGPVTRHLKIAMEKTYQATPNPKIIVAIGDGACHGAPYEKTYACLGSVDQFLPVDVYIPGNPPTPEEILAGLMKCRELLLTQS